MLNIGRTDDRPEPGVSQLSDAELIQQLADTAKELGIEINLNYSFAQPPATEGPSVVDVETVAADVTDPVSVPAADAADDAAAADAARELRIAAQPETGARPVRAARSKPPYR